MKVTSKRQFEQLRIYVNGKLHLLLKLTDLIGFQSWVHGEKEYFTEYYFSSGAKITTSYCKKEDWIAILNCLGESFNEIG